MTLQLTREPGYSRGFFSARSVMGFLSDVYPVAADEVGKIHLIADERVTTKLVFKSVVFLFFHFYHIKIRDLLSFFSDVYPVSSYSFT